MTAQFTLNHPVAVTCPDCGGALKRSNLGSLTQFSCHIGHVYTAEIMMAAQFIAMERSIEAAMRSLSERADLAAVYNGYQRWTGSAGEEAVQALFRPLYTTAFLLADQIAGDGKPPAAVVMSSASSKTALGLGFALRDAGVERIGLTSPRNRAFAERAGVYDRVLGYGEIGEADAPSAAYVDFAGDGTLRRAVHQQFGDRLTASIVVGDTHWDVSPGGEPLPGARPEFFFAPTQLTQRLADWGPAEFERRMGESWAGFVAVAKNWLTVVEGRGADEVARQWRRMAGGDVDPAEGLMLSVHD